MPKFPPNMFRHGSMPSPISHPSWTPSFGWLLFELEKTAATLGLSPAPLSQFLDRSFSRCPRQPHSQTQPSIPFVAHNVLSRLIVLEWADGERQRQWGRPHCVAKICFKNELKKRGHSIVSRFVLTPLSWVFPVDWGRVPGYVLRKSDPSSWEQCS